MNTLNWPVAGLFLLLFVILNWRAFIVYQKNKFNGIVGFVSLWGLAIMFSGLVWMKMYENVVE